MVKERKTSTPPGYLTSEEAAKILGVSKYRLYQYVKAGRIPALTFGNAYMLLLEDVLRFHPLPSGRTRIKPPAWHTYRSGGKLLVTQIRVQIRQGQQQRLREKLQDISDANRHALPGTIARYIAEGDEKFSSIHILLIWKNTEMPVEARWQGHLATFQAELADVLDWETAHSQTTQALIHT